MFGARGERLFRLLASRSSPFFRRLFEVVDYMNCGGYLLEHAEGTCIETASGC